MARKEHPQIAEHPPPTAKVELDPAALDDDPTASSPRRMVVGYTVEGVSYSVELVEGEQAEIPAAHLEHVRENAYVKVRR